MASGNAMKFYEHHCEPLAGVSKFIKRLLLHHALGITVFAVVLAVGAIGLRQVHDKFRAAEAVLEATLLSTGRGPVHSENIDSERGKYFLSLYAIFCRFGLTAALGVSFLPVLHRLLYVTFRKRDGV